MKMRLLFFLTILASIQLYGQITITGVVDGPLSGGTPKVIELYVYEDIADLSIYGVGSANNGGGTDGEEFTFPAIAVTSGQFIYITDPSNGGEANFSTFFGFAPDYTSNAASINGDDAIELFKDGTVVDVFGDINVDGTGEPWDYLDGWAYRNNQTGPDGSTFFLGNWSFSGINVLDDETSNSSATTPFPIGSYSRGVVTTPASPVAIAGTNITHEGFTANWNASSGATTYLLDVSESNTFSDFVTDYENLNVGNVTSYEVTGLTPEIEYHYRVRASNSAGTSDNSNTITVSTNAPANTTVQFVSTSGSVFETGGSYNLELSISDPSIIIPTTIDVVLITGDAGDIGGFTSETVTFPSGSSENQTVTISIVDDGVEEGTESLVFELQNITGGNSAAIGTQNQFSLTIIESNIGNYYEGIDPNLSTFVTDLKNRIRIPYNWVPYSQYDETLISDYYSQDNGNGTKSVFCVYSNYEYTYTGTFVWDVFSREHTFPHSWMPTNPADDPIQRDEYSDQHHLFPTHQNNANSVRSNHPLGDVTNITSTFGEAKFGTNSAGNTVYEPRDEHKGDAARAILYMMVRYDDIDGYGWGLNWVNANSGVAPQDLGLLIQWHEQDPPDQWEIERNDYIQSIQGNRNPFIDHPEYINYIDFYVVEYVSNSLFFSEYIEGSGDNKVLEIFNKTGELIDLSAENYEIQIFSNGNNSPNYTISLSGIINHEDVVVIANSNADPAVLSLANLTSGSINFNGNDAIVLVRGSEIVDVIGQIGFDPDEAWGSGDVTTADNTLRRKSSIGIGDSDGSDEFDPAQEWNGFPIDTFDGLGSHIVNSGPPNITNLNRNPNVPSANEDLIIMADIVDDIVVANAFLRFSIDGGAEQEIIMNNSTGSTYQGTIPNSSYSNGSLLVYKIYADDEDGAFSISSENKIFTGTTPIVNLKPVDETDKRLIHLNAYARISGVATVESGIFSTSSLDVYLQDDNSGINIFKSGTGSVIFIRGNIYTVEGKLSQFNGKAEIIPDNPATDIIDGFPTSINNSGLQKTNQPGVLPDPIVMTISEFLANPETYEGMLVGIQHISNTGAGNSWPLFDNNANVEITDNGVSTLTLRIDMDTEIDGSSEPSWPKDIVGIFNQFDTFAPYDWGYQIQPRDLDDIQEDGALPVELTTFTVNITESGVNLFWETATEVNNYGFDIERKFVTHVATAEVDNNQLNAEWEPIGFVEGYGNSNSVKNYSYADNELSVSGSYKYRLKQIDIDGKYEYSQEIEVEFGIPAEFEVSQNYPNPFNPTTTISYSIPERTNVQLIIFNLLGQTVKTLFNKEHLPGKYNFEVDASNFSSGTYFYRLSTDKNVETKKMILLK